MGVPFRDAAPVHGGEHVCAFVRTTGPVRLTLDQECESCLHEGMDGTAVTEALVTGPGTLEDLRARHPDASLVVHVRSADWVRQSILAAAGRTRDMASPGTVGIHLLRAAEDEWHLVSHPRALCAVDIITQMSRCFDRWVEL